MHLAAYCVCSFLSSDLLPQAFFFAAAFALAAFFLLLRIITMLRKEPTTAEPSRIRMTGMRIAQTRGGKKFCSA
jgi:hypothetical protein